MDRVEHPRVAQRILALIPILGAHFDLKVESDEYSTQSCAIRV